jgi:putative SOS response-associated peptidase YedK
LQTSSQLVGAFQLLLTFDDLAFSGLWDRDEATIITTEANDSLKYLHERMPVIVDVTADSLLVDPSASAGALQALLFPYPDERMEAIAVSSFVSNSQANCSHGSASS